MIAALILYLIGAVFLVMGYLIRKKQKITLLHDYHFSKVSEGDKKAFCTLSGIGVTVIGAGILITAVIIGITDSPWSFIAFAVGLAAGIGLLCHAGRRYNR